MKDCSSKLSKLGSRRTEKYLVIQLLYSSVLTLRTQSGIVWVLGERWWVLMTMTVMMMEAMTKTMVKSMYFPMSGTALEVEGISSTMTSRNTVRDSKTEMLRVIFSPGRHRNIFTAPAREYWQNIVQYTDAVQELLVVSQYLDRCFPVWRSAVVAVELYTVITNYTIRI